MGLAAAFAMTSCSDEQQFTDYNKQAKDIDVQVLNPELAKVRDYVPLYAVIAHRGSTYWTPEETEASWRWAREMGADYLESDLQATKDGVVLSLHDDNLKRTTNIQSTFSDQVPNIRKAFYRSLTYEDGTPCNFSEEDIDAQYNNGLNGKALEIVGRFNFTGLNDLTKGEYYSAGRDQYYADGYMVDWPATGATSVGGGDIYSTTVGLNYAFNKYAQVMLNYTWHHINIDRLPHDKNVHSVQARVQFTF